AFVPNPMSPDPVDRLYRTGDLAKTGADGLVYFLGRADSQIKSRGYRIELGEIETALNAMDFIQECAVVAIPTDGFEGTVICCAYVPRPAVSVTPAGVRKELARVLPSPMLPSRWMALDRPGAHHAQAQLGESKREHPRHRFRRAAAIPLIAQHRPDRSRLEMPIHVGQPYHTGRDVTVVRRIRPEHVDVPLGHDLQRYRVDHLDSIAEVQPFVVVGLAEPTRHQFDQFRTVQRQQFHRLQTPP